MIEAFVKAWDARKGEIEAKFRKERPGGYKYIVRAVVEILSDPEDRYGSPDPDRIHQIDDGDYQGTLVFVIGASGYQPSDYWYVMVGYGSCSGCDTLQAIQGWDDEISEEEVAGTMTLALHILQGLHKMKDE